MACNDFTGTGLPFIKALELPDRGIVPRTSEDRGGNLLRYTYAPCLIAEPFFINNDEDLRIAMENREQLITAYADTIVTIAMEINES